LAVVAGCCLAQIQVMRRVCKKTGAGKGCAGQKMRTGRTVIGRMGIRGVAPTMCSVQQNGDCRWLTTRVMMRSDRRADDGFSEQ
jgi:hypothetical protein